jgi:hypothetical protein
MPSLCGNCRFAHKYVPGVSLFNTVGRRLYYPQTRKLICTLRRLTTINRDGTRMVHDFVNRTSTKEHTDGQENREVRP